MKIKSLLLGSAVAALTVTGARAADAIIYAEPEPMEYVRICDTYGAGYFYIPGTETCLQISGFVWAQGGGESYNNLGDTPSYHFGARLENHLRGSVRARVNFDARSDTEWGTLRSYIRIQTDWEARGVAQDGPAAFDQAFLELGGLRMGYTESAWVSSQSAGVAQFGSHTWGGMYYGYQQRQLVSYTFAGGNGFHATLSLENDQLAGNNFAIYHGRAYIPDVVGVVGVNQGWGGAWVKAGWDEDRGNLFGLGPRRSGWGVQAGLQVNVPNYAGSSLRVIGYYANSDNQFGPRGPWSDHASGLIGQPRWSVLGSYRHQFNSSLWASVGLQYFHDFYLATTSIRIPGSRAWAGEAAIVWSPVTNFEVRGEYVYTKARANGVNLDGTHSAFLRFQRSF